ncbi:hypothetical protein PG990_008737 [Apiospora arundinis]
MANKVHCIASPKIAVVTSPLLDGKRVVLVTRYWHSSFLPVGGMHMCCADSRSKMGTIFERPWVPGLFDRLGKS